MNLNENTAPSSEGSLGTYGKAECKCSGSDEKPSSPEPGGSAFVYFILVYPVLIQTVPRPCGSRTFNSRPWEKKAAVDVQ